MSDIKDETMSPTTREIGGPQTLVKEERYAPRDALESCRTLAKALHLPKKNEDITSEKLHEETQVSMRQLHIDNKAAMKKVEDDRVRHDEAIEKVRKFWDKSSNGMPLAATPIPMFGIRFAAELAKIARNSEPIYALYLLNGELINRLKGPPRPGRRTDRCLMPSEFVKVSSVLTRKTLEKPWDGNDMTALNLRFNKIGMLGEANDEYTDLIPPQGEVIVSFEASSSLVQPKAALANLRKWRDLGIDLPNEATSPPVKCFMDKLIVHRSTVTRLGQADRDIIVPQDFDGENDTPQPYEPPMACKCPEVDVHENWYSTLNNGYIAKPQLANALDLTVRDVKHAELGERLEASRTPGALKYAPPDLLRIQSAVSLDVRESTRITKCGFVGGSDLLVHLPQMSSHLARSAVMYRHHNRECDNSNTGSFVYNCYFSVPQQMARKDLTLWRTISRQRLDGEFRLISIPLPMMEIRGNKSFGGCFTHGDLTEIIGAAF
ncbi:hypothetical protein SBOR_6413 [Sclerotinia borealis F-4128]|uniref:Uncharacterized protein n=1 Tax=Sclerotinia borealis (strain F-4128) TaxID=1432307 RepID=W9C8X5_SCLBF|nr:hypothetical protein SBOR_6413 [Sclerotinia borealis F-4128]